MKEIYALLDKMSNCSQKLCLESVETSLALNLNWNPNHHFPEPCSGGKTIHFLSTHTYIPCLGHHVHIFTRTLVSPTTTAKQHPENCIISLLPFMWEITGFTARA